MHQFIGRLLIGAATATLALLPQAQATVLDFDNHLPRLYADGDVFQQSGFAMVVDGSFGTIDTVAGLGALAPTGNATQFYSGFNDSGLLLLRKNLGLFSLTGLDTAFIPPVPQGPGVFPGGLSILGLAKDGSLLQSIVGFSSSAGSGKFSFTTYSGASFSAFNDVRAVEFFACTLSACSCINPNKNLGQFALDNVKVTEGIPEPATALLLGLGLAGLAVTSRRRIR